MSTPHVIDNIQLDLAEGIPAEAGEYTRAKVDAVAKFAPADVPFATVRLTFDGPRLIVAHARLDVGGTPVNAEATAPTYQEAADALHDRLRHLLVELHH
ncbi:hypothetical protein [Saccharothrix violaceirubra]|uniref:Sigma 54 modulation/S30EA-like ribosomal protein n=1 Tax=Saccharothrix violaceirubra TaxID=413306 RepID=A0A7W7T316_9PSEU|nr:hypothetical protein [Saccharothrix violaceirubra]MBB4965654.1 hypothetical protein [Saccharothrix violaceirubra]